jgi:hypothetical protein
MAFTTLRLAAVLGATLGLGILAAIHPMVDGTLIPEDRLGVWNAIHALQVPLAALLGVALLLMLHGVDGPEAAGARLAVVPWVAAFAAFDGVAGLATGAISRYGHDHPADADVALGIGQILAASPVVSAVLPLTALLFALLAFGGGAIALRRAGLAGAAAVAIAVGGITWTFMHPLVGAPAMAVFLLGALALERSQWRVVRSPSPVIASVS